MKHINQMHPLETLFIQPSLDNMFECKLTEKVVSNVEVKEENDEELISECNEFSQGNVTFFIVSIFMSD